MTKQKMPKLTIVEGKMVDLVAGDYDGKAGMQGDIVAYRPGPQGWPKAGEQVKVDNQDRTVAGVRMSDFVREMVLLELEPA